MTKQGMGSRDAHVRLILPDLDASSCNADTTHTMAESSPPTSHPFTAHLVAVLSIYELGPGRPGKW
jgi:hypothetical protein